MKEPSEAITASAAMQDALIRQILAEMGRQRMSGKALCKEAGISESHWSEMKNLKRAISLDKLCAVGNALGIVFQVPITPQKSPPATAPQLAESFLRTIGKWEEQP